MVEYFLHKACVLSEESLVRELDGMRGMTEEDKVKKVIKRHLNGLIGW